MLLDSLFVLLDDVDRRGLLLFKSSLAIVDDGCFYDEASEKTRGKRSFLLCCCGDSACILYQCLRD